MVRIMGLVRGPRTIRRLSVIAQKFIRHGLGYFVERYISLGYLPARFKLKRVRLERPPAETLPARLVRVMQELGPTFVKLGQMLATRPDILPESWIAEFRRIYWQVEPFDAAVAKAIIEEELGRPVEECFREFSDTPRASGSIAQVHDAVLPDGASVVVKVRRPLIEKVIEDDLEILRLLAEGANRIEELAPLRLPLIASEFARGIRRELDFVGEASTISRFGAAFDPARAGSETAVEVAIPTVYWDRTTSRVITLERIEGRSLAEVEAEGLERLSASERGVLAERIARAFLRQYFEAGLFHADPHPGNLVWLPDGRIGLIDFGLTGSLTGDLRGQLGTILVALARGQMDLAAEVLADMGMVGEELGEVGGDQGELAFFKGEVAAFLEKYYGIPLENVDMGHVFNELMRIARQSNVTVPRDFVLLGKSVVTVASVTRGLDPSLNVASLSRPYAMRLAREKLSRKSLERRFTEELYHVGSMLVHGPRDLRRLARKVLGGRFELRITHRGLKEHVTELDRTGNRLALSVMLASIVIGSSQILSSKIGPTIGSGAWQMSALGIVGYLVSLALGLWLILGIFRSGRL
jgi:ubiquinone biosynthesis protein